MTSAMTSILSSAYQLESGPIVVRIQGEESHDADRAPVHFLVVLDTSGSMENDGKLDSVVRSLHFMLDIMNPTDELSLLTFSNETRIHFKQTPLTAENKTAIRFRLQNLRARGGTNLSSGLLTTRECLYTSTSMKQGILLLTDGHANIGVTSVSTLNSQASALLEDFHGLTVSSVGYGTDHNAGLLTSMAANGGGSYNVVTNLEDVATVFGDVLGGLQATIAQELKLYVPPTLAQLTPFPGHPALFLGDLQAGGEHVVLLQPVAAVAAAAEPLTFTLHAYETATGRPVTHTLSIDTTPSDADTLFGKIAVLRIQVVNFLKKVQGFLETGAIPHEDRILLEEERTRLLEMADVLATEPNPLLVLLKDELAHAEQYLHVSLRYARQTSTVLTQHVSHLGYARGVRCTLQAESPVFEGGAGAGAGIPPMPMAAPALQTTFSSPCQRSTARQLRQSTGMREHPDEI
jgi:hypothetical protein